MKKNQLALAVLFAAALGFSACSDDEGSKHVRRKYFCHCKYNNRGVADNLRYLYIREREYIC